MIAIKIIVYCDVITCSQTVSMSLPSSRVAIFFWLAYSPAFCALSLILRTVFSRVACSSLKMEVACSSETFISSETVYTTTRPRGQ
jgi:hypothetical protein